MKLSKKHGMAVLSILGKLTYMDEVEQRDFSEKSFVLNREMKEVFSLIDTLPVELKNKLLYEYFNFCIIFTDYSDIINDIKRGKDEI